jgi:hypothetical protein
MSDVDVLDAPFVGRSFGGLRAFLREPDLPAPWLSPRHDAQALHLDPQDLAEQAHVHRNTIGRRPGSRGVQDFLRDALRVISAGTDLHGDLGGALARYRNEPLAVFGYRTPACLVAEGRTDNLLRHVMPLEAGAVG